MSFLFYSCFCLTFISIVVYCEICSSHGHLENSECICRSNWKGHNCEEPSKDQHYFSAYNESIFFDWKEISLQRRILKLYNLDPNQNYLLQEDELFKENNIFLGLADGIDSISWDLLEQAELFLDRDLKKRENNGANKKIEKINKSNIFSSIEITDIIQGNLNDCSFFAALASILNLPNGSQYIYQAIPYYNEINSIYVTKWFLFGQYIYVSVNGMIPIFSDSKKPFFAQIPESGAKWVAILEKAWAKIWGSYRELAEITEELVINALVHAPLKQSVDIYSLFIKSPQIINDIKKKKGNKIYSSPEFTRPIESKIDFQNQNKYIMLAKSRPVTKFFIRAHAFSVLEVYNVESRKLNNPDFSELAKLTLFSLYNPWGIDIPENLILNKRDVLDKKDLIKHAIVKIDNAINNDGKIFVEYSIILRYFENLNFYANYENYTLISKRIDFFDLKAEFEVNFTLNSDLSSMCFLFFNLLNDNNQAFSPQIHAYQIETDSLNISPSMNNYTYYLTANDSNNMIYKGMSFQNSGKFNYTLKFKLKKFNYDIIDHTFLSFYVPNNSLKISGIYVSQNQAVCPENCNNLGTCNPFTGVCACFPNIYGKSCALTKKMIYNEPKYCKNSHLMSTGECKCLPGFDSLKGCEPCKDEPGCSINRNACSNPSFFNKCKKICGVKTCYIPPSQNACEVNKCNGRGICTTRGICIMCMPGFSGVFCEIVSNTKYDYEDDYIFDWNFFDGIR